MPVRPLRVALMLPALFLVSSPRLPGQTIEEFDHRRQRMVSQYIEKEGVHNPRVLEAMRTVPRHEFVPASLLSKAYEDAAFLIGHKQTISPPFVVAYMTQALDPQPGDRVLEIGTGSGYQAAILSRLVREVYTIEIVAPLGKSAEKRLRKLGYRNVRTKVGDGYLGWPEFAPFDKIIVTCSPESVPRPLVEQLKEGGRMIIPLGERYHQDMYLLEKKGGKLVRQQLIPTLFVPMTGRSEQERTVRPDPLNPQVANGGFEQREPDGTPSGWHYQRQMVLVDRDAPEGRYFARFENDDAGRLSQVLQGMAVDGKRVASLLFTLKIRPTRIVDGMESYQKASIRVYYYDEFRRTMAEHVPAHWSGTSNWRDVEARVAVPLGAREAIIRIGLNGAIGQLDVDDVRVTAQPR